MLLLSSSPWIKYDHRVRQHNCVWYVYSDEVAHLAVLILGSIFYVWFRVKMGTFLEWLKAGRTPIAAVVDSLGALGDFVRTAFFHAPA